jgi:hypothetical protein
MSKAASSSPKADPLREQLDELDQLMERMLALGLAQSKDDSSRPVERTPIANPRDEEGSQSSLETRLPEAHTNHISESERSASPEQPDVVPVFSDAPAVALASSLKLDLAPPGPTFVGMESEPGQPPAPFFADFQFAPPSADLALTSLDAPAIAPSPVSLESPASVVATESASPIVFVAWWLQPLALVDGIYDGSTRWLGPIGRGLRSRPIKNFLGLCGLAALIGAAVWMIWESTDWIS